MFVLFSLGAAFALTPEDAQEIYAEVAPAFVSISGQELDPLPLIAVTTLDALRPDRVLPDDIEERIVYYDSTDDTIYILNSSIAQLHRYIGSVYSINRDVVPCALAHELTLVLHHQSGRLGPETPENQRILLEGHAQHMASLTCLEIGNIRGDTALRDLWLPPVPGLAARTLDKVPEKNRTRELSHAYAWLLIARIDEEGGSPAVETLLNNPPSLEALVPMAMEAYPLPDPPLPPTAPVCELLGPAWAQDEPDADELLTEFSFLVRYRIVDGSACQVSWDDELKYWVLLIRYADPAEAEQMFTTLSHQPSLLLSLSRHEEMRHPFPAEKAIILEGVGDSALLALDAGRMVFVYRNDGKNSRAALRRGARKLLTPTN